ncbi:MAG TPA: hypothetical protein PKA51_14185 [Kiritimatiellia bacterium]|nr:hypothetical protein [Kiritimatiellia bacterium]
MNRLLALIVIGLAGYGGYTLLKPTLIEHGLLSGESVKPTSTSLPQPTPPPRPETRKITCPTCTGEGRLSYVDRRQKNHTYACPICGFHGSTTITIPAGGHVCPDCRGMGKTEVRKTRPDVIGQIVTASRCQRCNAAGWILPRDGGGSRQPTPNVTPPQPAR